MNDEHRENVHRSRRIVTSPGIRRWTRGAPRYAALGFVSVLLWATSGVAQNPEGPSRKEAPNPAARLERPGGQPPAGKAPPAAGKKDPSPGAPGSARDVRRPPSDGAPGPTKKDPARAETARENPGDSRSPKKNNAKGANEKTKKSASNKERAAARQARAEALEAYRQALRAEDADPAARAKAVEDARKQLLDAHRKGPRPRPSSKRIAERDDKLDKALEQARTNREERRKDRLTQLEKAHGDKLTDTALQGELLQHAWRVARLERLIQIAEASRRTRLVKKGQDLLQKENERHEARVAELNQGPGNKVKAPPAPAAQKGNE